MNPASAGRRRGFQPRILAEGNDTREEGRRTRLAGASTGSAGVSPASFLSLVSILAVHLLLVACQLEVRPIADSPDLEPPGGITGTFSIAAVDPESGICGAAVASRYPAVGKVVIYVRAGVGAFCTQHWHNPPWGERALDLLAAGRLPEDVLAELLRDDERRDKRQLAVVDMKGRAANRNPSNADPSGVWWGAMSGRYYACQGNTLTGPEVVIAMARAYEETKGSLADRLMAALVAGDCAGGDHRGRLAAGIRIAKKGVDGNWLELYVDESDDAVVELARKYAALEHEAKGEWRGARLPFEHPCPDRPEPKE